MEIFAKCNYFSLPRSLLENTSLTVLKLGLPCFVIIPVKNCFLNLKTLFLSQVNFRSDRFSETPHLVLSFPHLEAVELRDCVWLKVKLVEIMAPALTAFMYNVNWSLPRELHQDTVFKIREANLLKLEIFGVPLVKFAVSASSVVRAAIRTCDQSIVGMRGLDTGVSIHEFSNLKYLRLSGRISEGLVQLKLGDSIPRFDRLERLELNVYGSGEALLEILRMAPNVNLLILQMPLLVDFDFEDYNYEEVRPVPSCTLSHLKEVKIYDLFGTAPQMSLAKFLLKHSVKLEKVSVTFYRKTMIPKTDIVRVLSACPQGSARVSFMFH